MKKLWMQMLVISSHINIHEIDATVQDQPFTATIMIYVIKSNFQSA
jgi:hypothetical protein